MCSTYYVEPGEADLGVQLYNSVLKDSWIDLASIAMLRGSWSSAHMLELIAHHSVHDADALERLLELAERAVQEFDTR